MCMNVSMCVWPEKLLAMSGQLSVVEVIAEHTLAIPKAVPNMCMSVRLVLIQDATLRCCGAGLGKFRKLALSVASM